MLNLDELYKLLELNKQLTKDALCGTCNNSTRRLTELAIHRNEVKNCIIQILKENQELAA